MKEKIYLASPHMGGEERTFVEEAFKTNWIAPLGKNVDEFENEVSSYVGTKHGLALNSGTAAIHLGLKLLGVKKDDIVFCSSLTFVGSCNPIIYEGGVPVFIDSDEGSYNISIKALRKAFEYYKEKSKKVKCLIIVNLYGQTCDMDEIKKLCDKYDTKILEDAAESLGAKYKGKQTGGLCDIGIVSFNGNKIITTSGGGMILSNSKEDIDKARFWSTQAKDNEKYYSHTELGYNYRLSNICAGIGRGQIRVLDERILKKKEIYDRYKEAFEGIKEISMMKIEEYSQPNYWLSVIQIDEGSRLNPIDLINVLEKENIEARHVWKPMHLQPYYQKFKFFKHSKSYDGKTYNSEAEKMFERGVCLPSDTKMTDDKQNKVIRIIKDIFNK